MTTVVTALFFVAGLYAAELSGWMATKIHSPKYPILGLQAMISGTVRLKVHIDSDGAVGEIKTLTGNSLLADAARESLRTWRFARVAGSSVGAVASDVEFVYEFRLRDKTAANQDLEFVFEYPDHITVTASPPHWMP